MKWNVTRKALKKMNSCNLQRSPKYNSVESKVLPCREVKYRVWLQSCLTHAVHPVFNVRYHRPCHQGWFKCKEGDGDKMMTVMMRIILQLNLVILYVRQRIKSQYDRGNPILNYQPDQIRSSQTNQSNKYNQIRSTQLKRPARWWNHIPGILNIIKEWKYRTMYNFSRFQKC